MKMTRIKKTLSLVLCIVLIAAIALFTTACNGNNSSEPTTSAQETTSTPATEGTTAAPDATVLGKGETKFTFTVTDLDGKQTVFEINTDKKTVGEALLELELIAGDDSEYGLYVKTVNGTTLDYDKDGAYWAFYTNGEYAIKGVDSTNIVPGETYELRAEKG